MAQQRNRDVLAWGIILIVIGVILLISNLDVDIWDYAARLWPLILIFWGGWKLYFALQEKKEKDASPLEKP